jgi:antitoxin ParD1/3/4
MERNTSFSLGEHFEGFIAREIATGSYGNASEVVRAGLRLLEHEKEKLALLRAAIDKGLNSPESEDINGPQALTRVRKKHRLSASSG